jgi:hypothetical protein
MVDPATTNAVFWDVKASGLVKPFTDLISAIAWPIATVLILRTFKDEILKLIPSLSELEALGIKAKFDRVLNKAEQAAEKISAASEAGAPPEAPAPLPQVATPVVDAQPTPAPTTPPTTTVNTDFVGAYSIESPSAPDPIALRANPTGIVMASWQALEDALLSYLGGAAAFRGSGRRVGPAQIVASLANDGLLSSAEVETLVGLIELHNLAAHSSGHTISKTEAKRFNEVAAKLTRKYRAKAMQRQIDLERARAGSM